MAFTRYTTPAKVRQTDAMLRDVIDGSYEFTDTVIDAMTESHTEPLMNSRLGAHYTVPFTEDDSGGVIAAIAAKITGAKLIKGEISQFTGEDPPIVKTLMEEAEDWMKRLISGEDSISHDLVAQQLDAYYEDDPENQPELSIFTGDPHEWDEQAAETRDG